MACTLLSPREIRSWDVFDGAETNWQSWSFATASALADLEWGPLLDAAKQQRAPIDGAALAPDVVRVSTNLYSLLAQKTRGKAQTVVRLLEGQRNGLEAWRQLWEEYSPLGPRTVARLVGGDHPAEVVARG